MSGYDDRWSSRNVLRRLVSEQRLDFMLAHDTCDTMPAAGFAGLTKISKDPQIAVNAAARGVGITNRREQSLILDRTIRQWPMQPRIEATTRGAKHTTHRSHAVDIQVLVDKAVLHSG
jgi:hypothetical protein